MPVNTAPWASVNTDKQLAEVTARLATGRAVQPHLTRAIGGRPVRGSRPKVGFKPHTPQNDEGTRIEPLVSEPSASGTWPAATAAPEPPEEPPATWPSRCSTAPRR